MAVDSWPRGVRPQCHHSNSRKNYEDPTARVNAHSDWYYEAFNDCGNSVDVVLECKKKELAVFKYIEDFVKPDTLARQPRWLGLSRMDSGQVTTVAAV